MTTVYQPTGHIPTRTELRTGQPVSLLTVTLGVTIMRWSSHPVVVPTVQGEDLPFPGGINAQVHERLIELFSDSPGETEASFNDLPDLYGLGQLIASGAVLGAAAAEFSLWFVGTLHEDRDVFVNGFLSNPEYGGDRDPVNFTIVERGEDNTNEWPPAGWIVNDETWSSSSAIPDDYDGVEYPTILGQFDPESTAVASRALKVDENGSGQAITVLIAGHWVASDTVGLVATDGSARIPVAEITNEVVRDFDDVGQRVSFVDVSTEVADFRTASQIMVLWTDAQGGFSDNRPWFEDTFTPTAGPSGSPWERTLTLTSGTTTGFTVGPALFVRVADGSTHKLTISGLTATTAIVTLHKLSVLPSTGDTLRQAKPSAGLLTGAGDVLIWILERTNLRWNRGRWFAARDFLNDFDIGCVIEESVDLWEYARSEIIPILPISIAAGAKGIEPIVWRYDATADQAIAVIRRGPGVWRDGPVQYLGALGDISNQFKVRYAVSALTDEPRRVLYLDGGLERLSEFPPASFIAVNAASAKSQSIHGIRRTEVLSNVIWKRGAALKAVAWMSIAFGFLHRKVSYVVGKEFGYLRPGDVVSLTDDELGEVDRVALVAGVTRGDAEWMQLQLQIVTNPATSQRTTGPNPDGGDKPPPN